MLRLVVLSILVASTIVEGAPYPSSISTAVVAEPVVSTVEKTIIKPEVTVVEEPIIQKVGHIVKSFPAAISHHSSSVIHNHGHIVEPIVAHGVTRSVVETPLIEKHIVAAPAIHKTIIAQPAIVGHPVVAPLGLHGHGISRWGW